MSHLNGGLPRVLIGGRKTFYTMTQEPTTRMQKPFRRIIALFQTATDLMPRKMLAILTSAMRQDLRVSALIR